MRTRHLVSGMLGLILVATAAAQHGQGNRTGQQGQGRPSTAGPQGSAGTQQGGGQGQESRSGVQASKRQRQQLETCTQSAERVRSRVRQMARISAKQPITPDTAKEWREQLRLELEAMKQNQEQFSGSLTQEQKTATEEQAQNIETSTEKLEQLADAVDMELGLQNPTPAKVKETAQKMESETDRIRNEQKKMESVLTD